MLQNVNATRMELLLLRRRLALALRGHYLLTEKRDEISRQLIQITNQIQPLRQKIEAHLRKAFQHFILASASMEPENLKAALEIPTKKLSLVIKFTSVMNVKVPQFEKQTFGEIICYGFAATSCELDVALLSLEKAFDGLIELAEKEKQARLLGAELQMTRRRVNVLEHIIIPNLKDSIKYIFAKLGEAERDNITRLMKITDIIRK